MPVLPTPDAAKTKRIQIRESIAKDVLDEIERYCKWLGCEKKGYFFEHASRYVFAEDADWQAHKNGHVPVSVEIQQTPFESIVDSKGVLE